MNIVPSIVAAGVAQTALQAQQVGRQRAARSQQAYRQTRMVRETAEIHLKALDENDQGHAGVHVGITDDLPDNPSPETPRKAGQPHARSAAGDQPIAPAGQVPPVDADAQADGDKPIIRHLDVQA